MVSKQGRGKTGIIALGLKTYKLKIKGRVQGVGFRPFVFNLAKKKGMLGHVSNSSEGVVIYTTTTLKTVHEFLEEVIKKPPPVSIIKSHTLEESVMMHFEDFRIIPSSLDQNINLPLTPDFVVCPSCKVDIKDEGNRRYGYPFTTCVNCGPRYAITSNFPFERRHTSLRDFNMCEECEAEYKSPSNRRFHSQTNSCKECGIKLSLKSSNGKQLSTQTPEQVFENAAGLLINGKIIAVKNTNGYLICCDATNEEAIKRLRVNKNRPIKPFAVLYSNIMEVAKEFQITNFEKEALESAEGPIVLLKKTYNTQIATELIAPRLNHIGVMLPSSALLVLLLENLKIPLVCTSGNLHGSPIITDNEIAQKELSSIVDYFVHHDLTIQFPQDDSVMKVVDSEQLFLRRSRGFAPNFLLRDKQKVTKVLAMGSQLKSTFTLVPNAYVYVSQYLGNLDNYDVYKRFEQTINKQLDLFKCKPNTIIIDAHPTYQSSSIGKKLAKGYKANVVSVQHHKAHFASVLGEHQMFDSQEKVLGVIWDGTGFGSDGCIWGGEFFIYENYSIKRVTHFNYYEWVANDKMAKEPRIALLSLLGERERFLIKEKFSPVEWKVYNKLLKSTMLKTSSVGRLFDAVASALDLTDINTFEAEAAMLLENCALSYNGEQHTDFLENVAYEVIPSQLIIEALLKARKEGSEKSYLAYSFIYTLAKSIIIIANKYNVRVVACSGGVFQNVVLLKQLKCLSEKHNIKLILNRKLSSNDENISFGQLMYFQNITN